MLPPPPRITWLDDAGQPQPVDWRSLAGHAPPARLVLADEGLAADAAFRLIDQGSGLLWRGSYPGARLLLQALGRRLDKRQQRPARPGRAAAAGLGVAAAPASPTSPPSPTSPASPPLPNHLLAETFLAQRRQQAERALLLGRLLLPFDADHGLPLHRAPDVRAAGLQAHGPVASHYLASLRELLGVVGAYEWRRQGVPVAALGARIHPHHGVFSPVRGEYVDLVAAAPLPAPALAQGAFDIGTGTGVLAAVLARRGLAVVATDLAPAALACAADNLQRLGLAHRVSVLPADLFPPGRAGLIVCNPPWVPAPLHAGLDAAVYDPDSRMLRGWLAGLAAHLVPGGEGWLVLSDLAEHLGLRQRAQLLGWIEGSGLRVLGRQDTRPVHRRALDAADPLHAARSAEVTSLWRLAVAP